MDKPPGRGVPLLRPEQYRPAIVQRFARVAQRLRASLPGAQIEHIGSSAVAGAVSKGDLDVAALVAPEEHAAAVQTLAALGYRETPDTLRAPALCMLDWHWPGEQHAVQVIARGSRFEMFIAFRDALRAEPALVAEYNRVKADASGLSEVGYRAAKSEFIERVLQARAMALPSR